ncbi:MAG: hypothetical protein LBR52_03130 [Prevotellaceae bacterium]|nr:hypothetical protein [Prevotellaceae bacterium]
MSLSRQGLSLSREGYCVIRCTPLGMQPGIYQVVFLTAYRFYRIFFLPGDNPERE